ncbi:MAG: bifunctional (p)ppGpp synthetase/guanosine-3',5'-bis(diphosphate) 3'-pyrophosphohydrolase [Candidatus Doudnabacteria bacterium]|nr:bifunctional (p)ppGpp synthetase/guanosine-3',5'-bis(diphosphate) 3'-pyrophosphohydrolase [Candidatus Doudnabacteria bacterium]
MTIQELIRKHQILAKDQKLLRAAFDYAQSAHAGQKRQSGEDYIQHPLIVADYLATWGMDPVTVAAALLHDVPENSEKSLDEIKKKFGDEVTFLVLGVTKLGQVKLRNQKDPTYIETLKRMVLAMAKDIRVVLIKLADRLHNMQTITALSRDKQERIARETLEVYASLAARLGMGEVRGQLEDLAFPIVYPKEYNQLVAQVRPKLQNAGHYINVAIGEFARIFRQHEIPITKIEGRIKHLYSLYQKLQRQEYGMDMGKVYDIIALRIITDSVEHCYAVLGTIHQYFKPIRGRIKDYIAVPKPNGYKSLHTTVFGPEQKFVEIQIRTKEMHEEAEYGIASHWAYSDHGKPKTGVKTNQKKLEWVRQLSEWQKEAVRRPEEFLESLRIDFFKNRIFVFTPKGDVKDLPEGASAIDFAFAVHTELGLHCGGAKINGKMAKLETKLQNGDVVEILEDKKLKVTRDWLNLAATSNARGKIRAYLNKHESGLLTRLTPAFMKRKK